MSQPRGGWSDLYTKEDWWAIWLALGIIAAALVFFLLGSSIKPIAVKPPKWDSMSVVGPHFKTGIILVGATLPFTLIIEAGPVAFLQATIVSLCTFFTI
jgi:hypothetical protein